MSAWNRMGDWYVRQCNHEWAQTHGMKISTLDYPGWAVEIDLNQTDVEGRPFVPVRKGHATATPRTLSTWYECEVHGNKFKAYCDPHSLETVIEVFLSFAETDPSPDRG